MGKKWIKHLIVVGVLAFSWQVKADLYVIENVHQTKSTMPKVMEVVEEIDKEKGLEYLLVDIGYTQGKKVNEYLETGQEEILEEVMGQMYPHTRTEGMAQFFRDLYQRGANTKKPVEVIGIGKDRKDHTLEALKTLFEPYGKHQEIQQDLEEVLTYPSLIVFEKFKKKVDEPDSIYGEVLKGNDWMELQMILNSILMHQDEQARNANRQNAFNKSEKEDAVYLIHEKQGGYSVPTIHFTYEASHGIDWETLSSKRIEASGDVEGENIYTIKVSQDQADQPYGLVLEELDNLLKSKSRPISLEDETFKGLETLDPMLATNRLFVVGEHHGNSGSYDMQLYLTKYFNQKAGITKVFIECGYGTGRLINRYVAEGKPEQLAEIMEGLKGTTIYTEDFKDLLIGLYEYNLTLPQEKKIKIIGADLETNKKILEKQLIDILSNVQDEKLKSIREDKTLSAKEKFVEIEKRVNEDYDLYKKQLSSEDLLDLELLLMGATAKLNTYEQPYLVRERIWIKMFERLLQAYPKDKFFGQMGAFHAGQSYYLQDGDAYSVAEYLNKYSEQVKGQVISLMYLYQNSYLTSGEQAFLIGDYYPKRIKNTSEKFSSIHFMDSRLEHIYTKAHDAAIRESFQYGILIANSAGAKPYKSK